MHPVRKQRVPWLRGLAAGWGRLARRSIALFDSVVVRTGRILFWPVRAMAHARPNGVVSLGGKGGSRIWFEAWPHLHQGLVRVVGVCTLLVLGKVLLLPGWGSYRPRPLALTGTVSMDHWRVEARLLSPDKKHDPPETLWAASYRCSSNLCVLDVEARYVVDATGEVKDYFRRSGKEPSLLALRQVVGSGGYGLFRDTDRVYLSACIGPEGNSTVTARQFSNNRRAFDRDTSRLLRWMLGVQPLHDARCVWIQMSIALGPMSADEAEAILEGGWLEWYRWWRTNFPKA